MITYDTGLGFSHGMRWDRMRWFGWRARALVTFGTQSRPGKRLGRRFFFISFIKVYVTYCNVYMNGTIVGYTD